ncbi:hypothetical protein EHW99_3389 [Erwinia amylovora]|uniref:Uncharacterized protein n=3 Tax=Erwinia amylovora TaxID=552 RepID=A0A831A460_ERWAM|nr:hypothetical protein EaACW_3461 [Erwinia amylovora ACW56400]QJQ56088.1 hypothetical protein EHX00_3389 [Erwinia amylovora]CBA23653.1 hypothetical protein predicted by Glimmer/Critica [Erwinia amylovora CFBP1430]CBX82317.1 hypothetical protein predicted by Glimmer/Critica [Erwinia amylovora ATCC BAA-2158]CCO80299.1 hypothetical protein BN432_3530 [Erwinia amylovora Ea356]CCO84105.1 hypothetical protein BN433_3559 [Erwinia amylovora Ea266]CCO87864.1 hypothetical protein BN434_3505 [Erwinia a
MRQRFTVIYQRYGESKRYRCRQKSDLDHVMNGI